MEIFLIKLKRFIKNLKGKKFLRYNPNWIIVDTTSLCNNNCYFCWRKENLSHLKNIPATFNTMPFEIFKKIIDDVTQYDSVRNISFSGPMGDPMMNKDFAKFARYAKSKKHFKKIAINTNGLAVDKHDIRTLLSSINSFSFSVDSIDPETYGKIHGNSENLKKVIDNIKKCITCKKEHNIDTNIIVRFTENELNIGQYPEFRAFFEKLGVDKFNYTKVHSFIDVKEELMSLKNAAFCDQPRQALNFTFTGELTTCCINWHFSPLFGNIKDKTIKELWEGEKYNNWLSKMLDTFPCNKCSGLGTHVQKKNLKNK